MRSALFIAVSIFLFAGGATLIGRSQTTEKRDLGAFLPKEVLGWKVTGDDQRFDPQTIFDYIDGGGEVYRAYNFKQLFARRYGKPGRPEIIADFFDMGSSNDAFGVFTHDLEGDDWGIGQGSTYKGGLLSFWRDRYFVALTAEQETPEMQEALEALGKQIAAAIGKDGPKPALLSLISPAIAPEKSIHFLHSPIILNYHFFVSDGNVLKLDQKSDAVLAGMGEKGKKLYLLLVHYMDAKTASQAYASFTKVYMPDAREPGLVETEDKKWTAVRCQGPYLTIVFSAPTAAAGKDLLSRVERNIKGLR